MTHGAVGAALCFSLCPTVRSPPRAGNGAVRWRMMSPPCRCLRPTSEQTRNAFFAQGRTFAHRKPASCPEALGRGLQRTDGGAWQDAHRPWQLLEGPETSDPQQGLYPRLPASDRKKRPVWKEG